MRLQPHHCKLDLGALLPYFKAMPQIDTLTRLSRIRVPTLLISGSRDPIVPPEESHRIAGIIAEAELVVLEGAGHLPFMERADEYHRPSSRWLAKTE